MRTLFCVFATVLIGFTLHAQDLKTIQLNTPNKDRGASVMKALADRHSERDFASKKLSLQDLSDLLWAATGINRKDGKRTAASALNKQDVDVYAVMEDGAYLYDPKAHALKPIAQGDYRPMVGSRQTFVNNAPVCLVIVSDYSKFGSIGTEESRKIWGAFDAGLVSQNVALFCAGCGLVTVPRGTMDVAGLKKVLKLSATQLPVINNPVGYAK